MAQHVKLPKNDEPNSKVTKGFRNTLPDRKPVKPGETTKALDLETALSDRVVLKVEPNKYVYCVRLRLKDAALGGFVFLVHQTKYTQEELQKFVDESVEICNTVRVPARRKEMSEQRIPCPDPQNMNEVMFGGDVDFVETVMVDKFGFKKLIHIAGAGEIIPTIVMPK